jgi:hypothetical protein
VKYEEAVVDYLSRVVGTLVAELQAHKIVDEHKAEELITIVQEGIDEIFNAYKVENFDLDPKSQI